MSKLSVAERAGLARLLLDRSLRAGSANLLQSPLLRWQFGAPIADQLLIVPQDLRTADPSAWSEINLGHFGLAGAVAVLAQGSPFSLQPPSQAWARELHGFGWLRHLDAANSPEAKAKALEFVLDWITSHRSHHGVAWEVVVTARRATGASGTPTLRRCAHARDPVTASGSEPGTDLATGIENGCNRVMSRCE